MTDLTAVDQGGGSKSSAVSQILGTPGTTPTVVSVGTEFHSTGAPTATLPGTHAANDILLLLLQSSNQTLTVPAGYTQIGPQNGTGTAVVAGATKLMIAWKRDGGSESAPTITDSGDHTYGVMIAIRGCPTAGDPFHIIGMSQKYTTSTSLSSATGRTALDNCLVVDIVAQAIDLTGGQMSSLANSSLTGVTEQFDGSTTDGTGGGLVVASGILASAGAVSAFTGTWASTTPTDDILLAFLPSDASTTMKGIRAPERQEFYGSAADLDDTWVKPAGARAVYVQLCDGGGSGSGGNTTTTAEGGGGGGGGGYDESWYFADSLGATVTVHAGKGGAAGTALNQAGNTGVVSEFNKGGVGPLVSAVRVTGIAATAAASADGGNGGSGSGRGTTSPAVQTTRLTFDGTNAARPAFAQGGAGGSGTTAPTGGGNSDWGGGGGESGADSDAATAAASNGWSTRGAGGGGGGRTGAIVATGGFGGGATTGAAQGAAGNDSTILPFGGGGGVGGASTTVTGGRGGFPGGGGGGGAGVAGGFGGQGGHGCVVVTTYFT